MSITSVLVVDDEPHLREAWARGIQRTLNYRVFEASNLFEAKRILLECQVDVVVTDLQIGSDSGLELIGWIRERHSFLPIVVVSGFIRTIRNELDLFPFVEILEKPTRLGCVCECVLRMVSMLPSWDGLKQAEAADV